MNEIIKEINSITSSYKFRYKYLIQTPEIKKNLPCIIYLHGMGERGDDINLVKKHGPFETIKKIKLPIHIIAPQCPFEEFWDANKLSSFIIEILKIENINKNQIYLTGNSMGGLGVWQLAAKLNKLFTAIIPICPWQDTTLVHKIHKIPTWIFHNKNDPLIPSDCSIVMAEEYKKYSSNAKITIYQSAEHDSWTRTYNNPEIYNWLLNHKQSLINNK